LTRNTEHRAVAANDNRDIGNAADVYQRHRFVRAEVKHAGGQCAKNHSATGRLQELGNLHQRLRNFFRRVDGFIDLLLGENRNRLEGSVGIGVWGRQHAAD
jgi:hypothetical protein